MTDEAVFELARHYLEIRQPDRALETLESNDADVSEVGFWRLRALALLGLQRHGEARKAAASGLAIEPDDLMLLWMHAKASDSLGDFATAEHSLLAALRIDPESDWLLAEYAGLVARAGQLKKALALLDEAARIDPESTDVATTRSLVAYLGGDDRQAAAYSRAALAADPEAIESHLMHGFVRAEQGRAHEAREHVETVARAVPADADVADSARELRYLTHPVLLPLWPVMRWGAGPVWLAGLALVGIAWATGNVWVSLVVTWTWLLYITYGWVAPPLLKAWLRWRSL